MTYYLCAVPVAPLRAEPAHRSEQVSQLLFGETAELLSVSGDFVQVRVVYDGYEGWCQATQLTALPGDEHQSYPELLTGNWITTINFIGSPMNIPMGSSIGVFADNTLQNPGLLNDPETDIYKFSGVDQMGEIRSIAFKYLNTGYQWGGRSVFGIDCSGFTQAVFRFIGIRLNRDASQQALQGEALGFLEEAKTGDLAFFDNEHGRITHVGILLDPQTIIHASGKVRVDRMDNMGIVSNETGKRTHNLRILKRLLSD